ncbi:hypothetical protein [Acetonema longum]|uniref:Uncharacterized protein n=1 Tax=Acetonema longum DSM 6540 TaxID=1009370 RepID=F7NEB3_9FIRM|nr:hypothetical protein [Acetonema longum]EGO65625.1 hypothetical protein ALO_01879 [Acetonema longum DSM 6540]
MELVNSVTRNGGCALATGGEILYVSYYSSGASALVKYNPETLGSIGHVQLSSYAGSQLFGMVYDNGFLYTAYYNVNYVHKIDYATEAFNSTYSARGTGYVNYTVATDNNYVYYLMGNGRREKYLKSNMSLALSYLSSAGWDTNPAGAVIKDGYIYTVQYQSTIPWRVTKIDTSTLHTAAQLEVPNTNPSNSDAYPYDLCVIGNYLYVILRRAPGRIAKIDLNTFQWVDTVQFPGANTNDNISPERCLAVNGYIYAQCRTDPITIIKIDPSTMQIVESLKHSNLGSSSVSACRGMAYADGYLYSLTDTRLAKIYVGGAEPPAARSYSLVIGGDL